MLASMAARGGRHCAGSSPPPSTVTSSCDHNKPHEQQQQKWQQQQEQHPKQQQTSSSALCCSAGFECQKQPGIESHNGNTCETCIVRNNTKHSDDLNVKPSESVLCTTAACCKELINRELCDACSKDTVYNSFNYWRFSLPDVSAEITGLLHVSGALQHSPDENGNTHSLHDTQDGKRLFQKRLKSEGRRQNLPKLHIESSINLGACCKETLINCGSWDDCKKDTVFNSFNYWRASLPDVSAEIAGLLHISRELQHTSKPLFQKQLKNEIRRHSLPKLHID
ncbi:unnamed protein product, partial [Meganyctiphanes norvegica]